jgi:hypothetical protein|eukprot:COSAG01_NODE_934_length_12642_cov_100.963805_9_plen_288_part_00
MALAGAVFCISGSLSVSKSEMTKSLTKEGAKCSGSLTASVTHVLSTPVDVAKGTSKTVGAAAKGIPVVAESFVAASIAAGSFNAVALAGHLLSRSGSAAAPQADAAVKPTRRKEPAPARAARSAKGKKSKKAVASRPAVASSPAVAAAAVDPPPSRPKPAPRRLSADQRGLLITILRGGGDSPLLDALPFQPQGLLELSLAECLGARGVVARLAADAPFLASLSSLTALDLSVDLRDAYANNASGAYASNKDEAAVRAGLFGILEAMPTSLTALTLPDGLGDYVHDG